MKFHLHPGSGFNLSRSLADIIFLRVSPRPRCRTKHELVRGKCNEEKFNQAGTIVDIGKHSLFLRIIFFFFLVRDDLYSFPSLDREGEV